MLVQILNHTAVDPRVVIAISVKETDDGKADVIVALGGKELSETFDTVSKARNAAKKAIEAINDAVLRNFQAE
jgi:hypothetical protein